MTIRTILVPFDGSEAAKLVMELGLRFGKDHGANVRVLNVRFDPKDTIPLLGEGMSVSMIEDMIQIAEKEGVKISDAAISLIARAADGSVRDGQSLLDQAVATGADGGAELGDHLRW